MSDFILYFNLQTDVNRNIKVAFLFQFMLQMRAQKRNQFET